MTITSIGYGDIAATPQNPWEQSWCAFLMLFGGMIWGMVIATFCGVIANLDPAGTEFRQTMDNLNRFMSLQGLPKDMRQQLREYFHQTRHLQIARANKLLIENMSPMLQGLVVWKVNEKWLRHVWFLRMAEDSFMVQLSLQLTAAVFAPAELCPNGYMYIVHRGIALYGGKVLTSGKVWGEDMILQSVHLRSKYAARCMTYVEVYMISRDDLIALATRFPATLKLIRRSAFRLGFRREMIRRAEDRIGAEAEASGTKRGYVAHGLSNGRLGRARRRRPQTCGCFCCAADGRGHVCVACAQHVGRRQDADLGLVAQARRGAGERRARAARHARQRLRGHRRAGGRARAGRGRRLWRRHARGGVADDCRVGAEADE
jgi:hypothetical protein